MRVSWDDCWWIIVMDMVMNSQLFFKYNYKMMMEQRWKLLTPAPVDNSGDLFSVLLLLCALKWRRRQLHLYAKGETGLPAVTAGFCNGSKSYDWDRL
jgi:hypothetical protein